MSASRYFDVTLLRVGLDRDGNMVTRTAIRAALSRFRARPLLGPDGGEIGRVVTARVSPDGTQLIGSVRLSAAKDRP